VPHLAGSKSAHMQLKILTGSSFCAIVHFGKNVFASRTFQILTTSLLVIYLLKTFVYLLTLWKKKHSNNVNHM